MTFKSIIRRVEEAKQGSALQADKIREEMKGDGVLASYPYYVSHTLTYNILINIDASLKGSTLRPSTGNTFPGWRP